MKLKELFRNYKTKKHTISLFKESICDKKFLSLNETKDFVHDKLISDKMGCYMYLMTVLGDDFNRSKYIDKQNNWLKDENGDFVIYNDFIEIVSKVLYDNCQ